MAFHKKHEEHENHERWLVSYADFITLLFAFFTVLYALSQTDKAKYKESVEAIERAVLSGGGTFPLQGSQFQPFQKEPDSGALSPSNPAHYGAYVSQQQAATAENKIMSIFEESTGLSLSKNDIEVVPTRDGYRIRLAEKVLFSAGGTRIRKENIPFLYEMGTRLGAMGMQIQVEGHSDNRPLRGESTWQTSLKRSSNIVKFLVEGANYPQDKIAIAGFGDKKPIASNRTPAGRARNRRVEISVIANEGSIQQLPW